MCKSTHSPSSSFVFGMSVFYVADRLAWSRFHDSTAFIPWSKSNINEWFGNYICWFGATFLCNRLTIAGTTMWSRVSQCPRWSSALSFRYQTQRTNKTINCRSWRMSWTVEPHAAVAVLRHVLYSWLECRDAHEVSCNFGHVQTYAEEYAKLQEKISYLQESASAIRSRITDVIKSRSSQHRRIQLADGRSLTLKHEEEQQTFTRDQLAKFLSPEQLEKLWKSASTVSSNELVIEGVRNRSPLSVGRRISLASREQFPKPNVWMHYNLEFNGFLMELTLHKWGNDVPFSSWFCSRSKDSLCNVAVLSNQ